MFEKQAFWEKKDLVIPLGLLSHGAPQHFTSVEHLQVEGCFCGLALVSNSNSVH